MPQGVNKAILIGNLGADPEVRSTDSGVPVATIRIATSEYYKDNTGERQTRTEWHTVVLWRGLADVADKFLHKGDMVYVEGRIQTRDWTDKEDVKRFKTEIVAQNLTMLGGRPSPGDTPQNSQEQEQQGQPSAASDEDLPF